MEKLYLAIFGVSWPLVTSMYDGLTSRWSICMTQYDVFSKYWRIFFPILFIGTYTACPRKKWKMLNNFFIANHSFICCWLLFSIYYSGQFDVYITYVSERVNAHLPFKATHPHTPCNPHNWSVCYVLALFGHDWVAARVATRSQVSL